MKGLKLAKVERIIDQIILFCAHFPLTTPFSLMSEHFPGEDFHLPGLTEGSTLEHQLTIAIAGAYSTVFNQRLLEHPFYGVWNMILVAIISDLGPNVYIGPQFTLDGLTPPLVNDEALVHSLTDADAKERTPDFVIVNDKTMYHPPYTSANIRHWRRIRIVSRQILLLVEGKRPPTRRPDSRKSFKHLLKTNLWRAKVDLLQT